MGFFDKFIPNEVKEVFKPVAKFSKKFIPKELRPFLPLATPFLPAMGIMGQLGGPMGFAKMYGANMLTQAMGDPEADFEDLNQISGILSGLQGGLSGPNTASNLRDSATFGSGAEQGPLTASQAQTLADRSLLTKASDLGKNISAVGSDYLTGNMDTLRDIGAGRAALNLDTAKAGLAAIAPDFAKATGDVAVNFARPAMRDYEKQVADEEAEIEATTTANESERASLQMTMMRQAGIPEETVEETLEMNGLSEYYTPPTESAAQGGIIGLKEGGMLNFGGREMDLRGGGFVPIGRKERADDVPARLSKNEFVMTADAVRAAGGGSVNKGAQRMYDVMNKLEARA